MSLRVSLIGDLTNERFSYTCNLFLVTLPSSGVVFQCFRTTGKIRRTSRPRSVLVMFRYTPITSSFRKPVLTTASSKALHYPLELQTMLLCL